MTPSIQKPQSYSRSHPNNSTGDLWDLNSWGTRLLTARLFKGNCDQCGRRTTFIFGGLIVVQIWWDDSYLYLVSQFAIQSGTNQFHCQGPPCSVGFLHLNGFIRLQDLSILRIADLQKCARSDVGIQHDLCRGSTPGNCSFSDSDLCACFFAGGRASIHGGGKLIMIRFHRAIYLHIFIYIIISHI